jgi:hypothetical protein
MHTCLTMYFSALPLFPPRAPTVGSMKGWYVLFVSPERNSMKGMWEAHTAGPEDVVTEISPHLISLISIKFKGGVQLTFFQTSTRLSSEVGPQFNLFISFFILYTSTSTSILND